MRLDRVPPINELGLVLPPGPLDYLAYERSPSQPETVDRHHLYWPRPLYIAHSALAADFREHRFNSVWLLRSDHDAINYNYDGVPVPARDVMKVFMQEARLLDVLDVTVEAVEMIDKALYEGRVRYSDKVEEKRKQKMGVLETVVEKALGLQVVVHEAATKTVDRALDLATAA